MATEMKTETETEIEAVTGAETEINPVHKKYYYDVLKERNFWLSNEVKKNTAPKCDCSMRIGASHWMCCAIHERKDSGKTCVDALIQMIDATYERGGLFCPTTYYVKANEKRPYKFHLQRGKYGYGLSCPGTVEVDIVYPLHEPNMREYRFSEETIRNTLLKIKELGLYNAEYSEDYSIIKFGRKDEDAGEIEKELTSKPPAGWFW